ncbi:MAG: hypothetical protein EU532_08390 [Promethearchaeota archaeon]|nr:MAG: hypothetical protein EU532_08390 [Candidatus Lokiarchaeota archaeon]
MTDYEKMKKAYQASSKIMEKRMEKERPKDLELLKKVKESSIIIVAGSYDKIELVLDLITVPYVLIHAYELDKIELNPDQMLIVNCPGSDISSQTLTKIKTYVENGGFLFTTDWALLHVLEKIFPEYVKYNQRPTADDCVRVEVVSKDNKFLKGLFEGDSDPIWWLESSSYPITILDKKKVKILVRSKEMENKYGEAPIVILFYYGEGIVLHMTSHYYLQRAELRTKRHQKSAKDYVMSEMAFSPKEAEDLEADLKDVTLGEAESAYSTTQFISNVIVEQQKKVKIRKKKKKEQKDKDSK